MTLEAVIIDGNVFEEAVESGYLISSENIGDYLQGFEYVWAERERQRLHLLWI